MKVLYTAAATAEGEGRNGRVTSADSHLALDLRVPAELGGPGGGSNPEQLFAAGYSACFHSALQTVARREKVALGSSTVTAKVGIGADGGGYALTVALDVTLPDIEHAVAEELVAKAHQVCPYSNATRGNVEVALTVVKGE